MWNASLYSLSFIWYVKSISPKSSHTEKDVYVGSVLLMIRYICSIFFGESYFSKVVLDSRAQEESADIFTPYFDMLTRS